MISRRESYQRSLLLTLRSMRYRLGRPLTIQEIMSETGRSRSGLEHALYSLALRGDVRADVHGYEVNLERMIEKPENWAWDARFVVDERLLHPDRQGSRAYLLLIAAVRDTSVQHGGSVTTKQVQKHLEVSVSAVQRHLVVLETNGYVQHIRSGRVMSWSVTDRGIEALKDLT